MLTSLRPPARCLLRCRGGSWTRPNAGSAEQNFLGLVDLDGQVVGSAAIGMDHLYQASMRLVDILILRTMIKPEDLQRFLLRHRTGSDLLVVAVGS